MIIRSLKGGREGQAGEDTWGGCVQWTVVVIVVLTATFPSPSLTSWGVGGGGSRNGTTCNGVGVLTC